MKKFRNIILAVLAVISFSSCKSQYELLLNSNDTDAKYKAAFEYFNNKITYKTFMEKVDACAKVTPLTSSIT